VPNFVLAPKMSGTTSATSTWLHPPDRPEIIDTLINGVGMTGSWTRTSQLVDRGFLQTATILQT